MSTFQNLIQKRRSVYHLGNHALLPQEEILHLIEGCVLNAPSSFNAQSARVVVLFGQPYRQFWDMVKRTLRAVVPADKFAPTEEKINSFAAGFGTILFFEDDSITQTLQQKFPLYRDKFPVWAQHGNAILQYM
ncbi:MAG: nitroreductase family protein, partial [Alphaproteobacteria bacterium]